MIDPRAMLIAGGILIVIIALAWLAIIYGRPEKTIKPIDFSKKN